MTFEQNKKQVGKTLLIYTDTNGWLTDTDVTETDIEEMMNYIYRDDLFPMFAKHYGQDFRQVAYCDSWIGSGTADAGLTDETLTLTTSVFTNSMEGLWLWNDTDETSAKIVTYTSATTVETDTDMTTWVGDTIYILGKEFAFGGEATDLYVIESVGLKRQSTDNYYLQAQGVRMKYDIYQNGWEEGSTVAPAFYLTTVTVDDQFKSAVGIVPGYTQKITKAIEISYIAKPALLTNDSDVPRLPVDLPLQYGTLMMCYRMKQQDDKANMFAGLYEKSKNDAISRYTPTLAAQGLYPRLPRRFGSLFNRSI